ncbi:MAG: hypothetical protein ACTHJQ_22610 [Rhizobiaceae bacterium]
MAIPAIGTITDPGKTRVALVQGQQIISAPATALSDAVGLISGGTTGQVLTKASDTDYDTEWADTGDFSGPSSATDGNLVAFDGTTGKLGKDSGKKPADFATAAQGAKADTAVQPAGLANYYQKSTILGTVSQSSGVPTGAIIEKGSNANGRYVRFADGTQICTALITLVYTTVNVLTIGWTFPAAFTASPLLCGTTDVTTPQSSLRSGLVASTINGSSMQVRLGSGSGSTWATTDTAPCYVTAIGTWF